MTEIFDLVKTAKEIGPWGLLGAVIVYIIVTGQKRKWVYGWQLTQAYETIAKIEARASTLEAKIELREAAFYKQAGQFDEILEILRGIKGTLAQQSESSATRGRR
jgi:hypothetical protein